jgi:hypothetical protein
VDSSRERDQSIERLLRQSRQSLQAPRNAGVTDSCLDAETLAAWVDSGLSGAALEMARTHVADCARCQSLVGALARINSAAPPAEPERAVHGWLAWLVPLATAAAAVAVWIAVPHHELDRAARLPQPMEIQRQAADTRTKEPALPAGQPQAPASGNNVGQPMRTLVPSEAAKGEADSLGKQSATSGAITRSASVLSAPAAPAATAAPSPAAAKALDSVGSAQRRAEAVRVEIVSPDPMIRWRIAGSGVQRSADGGASWEATSTGISTELTAGAAPSALVCWVVGRGGVVLVSTDGRSWRRVAFPEMTDLSGVRARDASTASVSTAEGRTFSTTDAGATWIPGPLQDF